MQVWQFLPATRHLGGFCWGPPTQDTGRCWFEDAYIGDGMMVYTDVTCCRDSGSLLSVCGDSWFILGAMFALHHRSVAPPRPRVQSV